jgi:drug/metabolite transporter (DMT)-like permease
MLVVAMAFWGLSWPISKSLVDGYSPILVGFLRFFIAAIIYIPIVFFMYWKQIITYSAKTYLQFFILGLLGIFGYGILFLYGMQRTTASQGSVLAGTQPVLISTLAFLFYREKLYPKWRYIGFIFSLIGVFIIIGIQSLLEFNKDYILGNILVLVALMLFASYTIYGKKVMENHSSLESTAGATLFGMILFGIGAVVMNPWDQLHSATIQFWGGILLLAIGTTVISFFLYFYAIKKMGPTRTGVFINLVPVFGTFFSVLILEEPIPITLIYGLLSISVGILIINFPKKYSKIPDSSEVNLNPPRE